MAAMYLRAGVWLGIVVSVVCGVDQSRLDSFFRDLLPPPMRELSHPVLPRQTRVGNYLHSEVQFPVPPPETPQSRQFSTTNAINDSQTVFTREMKELFNARRRLSRYDRVIARHAEEAGFDWRFVAALIFEESRFDHRRVSSAGASGLMQLMPFTAQLVGLKNIQDPHANIEAGVKYLSFLSRQFQDGRPRDRLALILASYVMGLGHVEDGQRIARLQGYDPDCWGESMELILPLLENPTYHSKTLYGYAQGREAVRYANAILERYDVYSQLVERDFSPEEVPAPSDSQAASAVAG